MRYPCTLPLLALLGCGQDIQVAALEASLVLTPTLGDVGTVALGDAASVELLLTHTGGRAAEVQAVDVTPVQGAGFAYEGELMVVEEGGTASIPITFAPETEGYHWALVTVTTSGDDDVLLAQVRGRAVAAQASLWPTALDFGAVSPGDEAASVVTVKNTGLVPWTLLDAVTDDGFAVSEGIGSEVAPGDEVALEVVYTPDSDSAVLSELVLETDLAGELSAWLRANDCEGGQASAYDVDGDGFTSCAGDCDDGDDAVHPAASETCDDVDDDCDGLTDEGTSCVDDDGDGYSEDEGDCNDGDDAVSPGETEVDGNYVDDDCDGIVDQGSTDADADGYAEEGGDCDDADGDVHPGAVETADGVDEDCDDAVDEGTDAYDDDGDGYSEADGDCDDGDADTSPDGSEDADGADQDCDGVVDEGTDSFDDDGDGWTEDGGDCDDDDASVSPGAVEVPGNSVDEDCDGVTE